MRVSVRVRVRLRVRVHGLVFDFYCLVLRV